MFQPTIVVTSIAKNLMLKSHFISSIKYWARKGDCWVKKSVDENIQHINDVFHSLVDRSGLGTDYFKDKTLVEIGPGDTLGVALMFIGHGCKKVTCIDRFRCMQHTKKHAEIYNELISSFDKTGRRFCESALRLGESSILVDPDKIEYLSNIQFEKNMLPDQFCDVVYSYDVLEHVTDVKECFIQMKRIIKKGGYCIHAVDLAGHGELRGSFHPLDILRYSSTIWRLMNSHRRAPNQVRYGEYRRIMNELGFDILKLLKEQINKDDVAKVKPHLSKEFKMLSDEELSVIGFFCAAKSR